MLKAVTLLKTANEATPINIDVWRLLYYSTLSGQPLRDYVFTYTVGGQ